MYAKWYFWAHIKKVHMRVHNILHPLFNNIERKPLLSSPSQTSYSDYSPMPFLFSTATPHPALPPPDFLSFTFAASITFEESQIFHGQACGRFPSTWEDSINLSWFAFLKLDKGNALCSTSNAFCIIPVFEYIFENLQLDWISFPGYRLPARSIRLFMYRFKISWC